MTTASLRRVYPATVYQHGELGSFGNADGMLLRQHNFPNTYSQHEKLLHADHDRCMMWDRGHASRCFQKHTGTGELGLEQWVRRASDAQIMEFLIEILKADTSVVWTGYRILGSVHRGNGYPVWGLGLFARDPSGNTEVFSGSHAPNVVASRR